MGVSRQVKAEAEHIFHNANLFVRITLNFTSGVYSYMKPFMLAAGERARHFIHHTVTLDFHAPDVMFSLSCCGRLEPPCCFMIAGEDLPWMVRTLCIYNGISRFHDKPFLNECSLSISAVGPFEGATTSVDGRACLQYQRLRWLLEPLSHLRGIRQASLDANLSAKCKHRVLESIHKPWLDVEASIDEASTFIGKGDEAFHCGRHLQAIYAYQEALDILSPFHDGQPWHTRCGALSSKTLPELFCNLFNRQRAARIRLEIRRKASEFTRSAQSGEDVFDASARAGVVYAIEHFSDKCSSAVGNTQYRPTYLQLSTQLEIIEGFDSDPRMKKALIQALVSIMKDKDNEEIYIKQWRFLVSKFQTFWGGNPTPASTKRHQDSLPAGFKATISLLH